MVFLTLLAFLWFSNVVHSLHNITLDDPNSMIVYSGKWGPDSGLQSSLDYGGAHTLTTDRTATATLTFTGIAVYFMSPLWPYTVNTALSLDSEAPVLVDLTDYSKINDGEVEETVQSQVVWGASGLSNSVHTLVASIGKGQQYAVVDAIIYTVLDAGDIPPSSTTPSSASKSGSGPKTSSTASIAASATTSGSSGHTPSTTKHTLSIALGSACGGIALAVLVVFFLFCCRRRVHEEPDVINWPSIQDNNTSPQAITPLTSPTTSAYSHTAYATNIHHLNDQLPPQSPGLYAAPPAAQYGFAGSNRYTANTLSTITESSQSPYGGTSSLPHSPASLQAEFGHLSGADRMSSVVGSRSNSSYQSSHYTGPKEVGLRQNQVFSYEELKTPLPPAPPAYSPSS